MSERLARTLFALSDANRLNIVELLKTGPLPVGEIAAQLALNQPQTSKHLKILLEADLVRIEPAANRRIYHLRTEPFQVLTVWSQSFEQQMVSRMTRLEGYLEQMQDTVNPKE
ncbi:winged helix-turn-helix transcriptional regulator [Exiguobacterium sp. Helios]|uniref:ArsR/SmtB family transcription factor n=1 Tax=Exiguobacterium sp. Helios TaxID=2735868 RepID=UPI00165D833F|nr:metalloregulator ArsR/SmtB family transcription factor [Exiguobacterium sp. Helios]QNR21092.1 winged helix-turn-helix transcriptional regulator [Exiguobacterium sp. Helios]